MLSFLAHLAVQPPLVNASRQGQIELLGNVGRYKTYNK